MKLSIVINSELYNIARYILKHISLSTPHYTQGKGLPDGQVAKLDHQTMQTSNCDLSAFDTHKLLRIQVYL